MDCDAVRDNLGAYLDGELAPERREELAAHLAECPGCADELDALRRLAADLAAPTEAEPPPALWDAIERRLDAANETGRPSRRLLVLRRPAAIAAGLVLAVGVGLIGKLLIGPGAVPAAASTIDFSVLLDGLASDAPSAVDAFLTRYEAQAVSAAEARRAAPKLMYDVPDELPGGFRLQDVHVLRFTDKTGIAARYARGEELLMTFAHPPAAEKGFGRHREGPCVVGQRTCRQVQVGPWRLVRLEAPTMCGCRQAGNPCQCGCEPTTCHCVLTRLTPDAEMPAVLAAIAPDEKTTLPRQ